VIVYFEFNGLKIVLLIIVVSTDHMDVQDNGMGYSSVSVALVGYDSSCPSMAEPREILTCGSHLYAPGRHERGIIRQYPHKSVQFFTVLYSSDAIDMIGPNVLGRERISCLALLVKCSCFIPIQNN